MIFKFNHLYIVISPYCILTLTWAMLFNRIGDFYLCFLALMIHEFGHIAMIYHLKEKISIFSILPIGFSCKIKNQIRVKKDKMIKILVSGPAVSLIASGIFFYWTKEFAFINLFIGILNLIPFGDLDGGRLLNFVE